MKQAAMLRITGRVQGVWYRGSTQEAAQRLGLSGWVRNETDGSVSAFVQGDRDKIDQLIEWCWDGPRMAKVELVAVEWTEADPAIVEDFSVRY